jgi:hypothetical protein
MVSNVDIYRNSMATQSGNVDTLTNQVVSYSSNSDTLMEVCRVYMGNTDILRESKLYNIVNSDILRRVPWLAYDTSTGILSVSVNLQERMLSDSFSMQTVNGVDICDAVDGNILDYKYRYIVEEMSQQGITVSVKGMYDVDKMLYTPVTYVPYGGAGASALNHAKSLAKCLDKDLTACFEDFYPTGNYIGIGATYQNIISGVFGWTDKLPQRAINVFLRKDELLIVQRGMEPNTIDITSLIDGDTKQATRPTFDRRIMRSTWFATAGDGNGNATDEATSDEDTKTPFTGTIQFADQSCSYVLGLLQSETHGDETTTYSYTSYDGKAMYPSKTVKDTKESTITTDYSYTPLPHDIYLSKQEEIKVNKKTPSDTTTTVTRYRPVDNGWYGVEVETDGEFVKSDLTQSKPGQKVSLYSIDQSSTSMQTKVDSKKKAIQGKALFDTEFPVRGINMLKKLTEEIEWLDRKIQETVSTTIYHYPHVIDFTDAIVFRENTYHLVSNAIVRTPDELKQSIVMVRWY